MHVIWYTAMSIDGRIAGPGDDLGFLDTIGSGGEATADGASGDQAKAPSEAEAEFPRFLGSLQAVVVGASTLRWLINGGHGWPHDDLPTWVVTHDEALVAKVGPTRAPLRRIEGDLAVAFAEIEAAGHQRVWLAGGGQIAGQALALDRVDEIVLTIAPTVLGAGPSLFAATGLPLRRFHLAECRAYEGGAARLRWERQR